MILSKPLRVIGIVLCCGMLLVATVPCNIPVQPTAWGVIRTTYPIWIAFLIQLCIDEGRARERAARERRDE